MAVCAARHHSSDVRKGHLNNVPRHQKTQAAERPGFPSELEPQGLVVRCLAGGNGDGLALSLPWFNNQVYDSVDASSLNFLLTQARMSAGPSLGGLGINLTVLVFLMPVMNWMSGHSLFPKLLLMYPLSLRWSVFGRVAFCG